MVCFFKQTFFSMKKNAIILFLVFFFNLHSQTITTDYVCTYNLQYNIYGKKENEQFIMFMNAKEQKSYFLSSSNYVIDTAKISDPMQLVSYESDFNERVISYKDKYSIYENVTDVKMSYDEDSNLKWEILSKTSKSGNTNVQMAKTKAYGRVWYAWFSRDIPIDFGPYKFRGLPGFIVSVFDEKSEFVFTLQSFKKKRRIAKLPAEKSFRKVQKKDFNKTRFKIQTADNGVVIFDNSKDRLDWFNKVEKRFASMPLLDVEFPIR